MSDPRWPRAGDWLAAGPGTDDVDLAVLGVPTFATSISPTGAHATPAAVRRALGRFSTWCASRSVDLADLAAWDAGDVDDPDVPVEGEFRVRARAATAGAKSRLVVAVGGDNSATYSVMAGLFDDDIGRAGLVTVDAHHDIREGRSNGSPVRNLIDAGLEPTRIVQVGIADWANSKSYADEAHARGITVITRVTVAERGVTDCIRDALDIAGAGGAPVYVDLDVDVCDRTVAPACPASLPGGLSAAELLQAAFIAGQDRRVRAIDITEVDATRDAPDERTVRLAAVCLLEAAAGLALRHLTMHAGGDWAVVGGLLYDELAEVSDDLSVLDGEGRWVVVVTFEGDVHCLRFTEVRPAGDDGWAGARPWQPPTSWRSSLDRDSYQVAVAAVRECIADGEVYQVNVCRLLTADLPDPPDLRSLGAALARGNPAPYAAVVCAPSAGVHVACASPELFLRRRAELIRSDPIKGTAPTADGLTAKDRAENVMIVDLVRNDLSRVTQPGSVDVPSLLRIEQHPGLVHLVSTVTGQLNAGATWSDIFAATFPPGSVTGAPKSSALRILRELEPAPRGAYCGAIGWVDADTQTADLAVGIRTYEWRHGRLHLGTGAGITWGSDPRREWEETELKVRKLLAVR